jgi:hypothetical protein
MNLCKIYFYERNFVKCRDMCEKALIKVEMHIIDSMKRNDLMEDPSDVILLLNGYLLYARSMDRLSCESGSLKFYQNGAKISRKYLGSAHSLTRKFSNLLSQRPSVPKRRTPQASTFNNAHTHRIVKDMLKSLKMAHNHPQMLSISNKQFKLRTYKKKEIQTNPTDKDAS